MGVVAINLVEFCSFLFEVSKNFRNFHRKKMMRRFLRGSSSRGSEGNENEEKKKPKYNLPRTTEVRPCEWPCDAFLKAAGIYEDFYYLAENAGITDFLLDQCDQYLLLSNIFMQNFHFHARRSPPMVDFYLYDEYKNDAL